MRVKLLKRQFGLPGDVLSLKSLSLASSSGVANSSSGGGQKHGGNDENSSKDRFAYGGVRHVSDGHSAKVTRLAFASSPEGGDVLISSSMDGSICVCDLSTMSTPSFLLSDPHAAGIADFDLSQSGELVISCTIDGRITLWSLSSRKMLRTMQASSTFCRFLPTNNNLVVCNDSSSSARVLNVSTGKIDPHAACPLLGRSLCAEFGQRGSVLWVGNDRGHVESVRISCGEGVVRLQKGCRISVSDARGGSNKSVQSLSFRAAAKASDKPILLAALGGASVRLFSVVDDFGTLELIANCSSDSPIMCATLAPLLCASPSVCAAAGSTDGSVVLMDLEREDKAACVVNKLLGHSQPVIAAAFSGGEALLATADSSGQIIVWKK